MSTAFSLSKCNNCITVVKEKAFAAKVVCEYEMYQRKRLRETLLRAKMVEVTRFELATSTTRTVKAL